MTSKYEQQARARKRKRKVYKTKANYGPTPRTTRNEPRSAGFHRGITRPGVAGKIDADNAIGNSNPMMNKKRAEKYTRTGVTKNRMGTQNSKKEYPYEPGRINPKRGEAEKMKKLLKNKKKKKK